MERSKSSAGPSCCGLSRRGFLAAGCAACAGGLLPAARPLGSLRAGPSQASGGPRVRVVFALHAPQQPGPDWPNVGFDFQPVMDRTMKALVGGCPGFTFTSAMAKGPEEAEAILAADGAGVDGYVVVQLNCWNRVVQPIAASGKPTLYADFQYGGSGGFLVYTAGFLRAGTPNLGFVASSRPTDLVAAVRCFEQVQGSGSAAGFGAAVAAVRVEGTPVAGARAVRPDPLQALEPEECLARMKASRILAVGGSWPGIAPQITEQLGIAVEEVPFAEVNAAWEAADADQAAEVATRWERDAALVEGVPRETLEQSAAMYLAQKAVLADHGAQAITINCLGGFYGGHIHAYPCLGFHQLLNEGLVGACECDLRSTATMVAMTALTGGRPGFISDPVIDTARRQIIYAHCVASNRPFGPEGAVNPFQILTHSEDRQGASVRSVLPGGYMTTTLELAPERKQVLLHRGHAVAHVDDDRACRTKLAAEPVGDIERLFGEWDQWGWHRVTYYGDLAEPVHALADALGWEVLQEA
jgi:hypothetical protein